MTDHGLTEFGLVQPKEVKPFSDSHYPDSSYDDFRHFYKSETCDIPELQDAIKATVLISTESAIPGGSGVIIHYGDKKLLVTNHHVVGNPDEMKTQSCTYLGTDGKRYTIPLSQLPLLLDSYIARERNIDSGDVAIFEFNGDNNGVVISEEDLYQSGASLGLAIGYPGQYHSDWKETLQPLLSFGKVSVINRTKEVTPKLRELFGEVAEKPFKSRILYSGVTKPGNSGGPLVDSKGKVLGICRGPQGSFGKETGLQEFIDFRPALQTLKMND